MIIVIDAYNMLKHIYPKRYVAEEDTHRFITKISKYAAQRGHLIFLVFDGGPYEWVHREKVAGIQLVYSGHHESADDVIRHYLTVYKDRDLLLVSTDRELGRKASRLGIASIDSADFYPLVQAALASGQDKRERIIGAPIKTTPDEDMSLDKIMCEATKHAVTKSEDLVYDARYRAGQGKRESKIDRKLDQKLKKL